MNLLGRLAILWEKYKGIWLPAKFWNKTFVDKYNEQKSEQETSTDVIVNLASGIKYY